ncbi:hypothetical protein DFP72DRAFT_894601 [Ephemerocybe angulata]|uniref:Uncharacterized protein n=1 Tax=Ephemerocybe angulata TaxID=980116 RepID=A0A8H6M8K5_9AGAR|nr:hypothetical protein DFP72DRAFT_894601 [Tulosesus angulatus]
MPRIMTTFPMIATPLWISATHAIDLESLRLLHARLPEDRNWSDHPSMVHGRRGCFVCPHRATEGRLPFAHSVVDHCPGYCTASGTRANALDHGRVRLHRKSATQSTEGVDVDTNTGGER